jgi:dihydroorotate dehydrogenase electron transfer subunit
MKPGQFFMIWIPGVDEIPMSVSRIGDKEKAITFRDVGEATHSLYQMKPGDQLGVRGPYGNGFTLPKGHLLFVGGGTGIAMLAPAIKEALHQHNKATVVLGVKTQQELFFQEKLQNLGAHVVISTDDGTCGQKGTAASCIEPLLKKHAFTSVITCGPELMMNAVYQQCSHLPFQASLERYMKCGIGLCGQCCVDTGLRVCTEGPVFTGDQLKEIPDFGVFTRDASGQKQQLKGTKPC